MLQVITTLTKKKKVEQSKGIGNVPRPMCLTL